MELKGFERVSLAPGESRAVRFTVGPEALAFYTAWGKWGVEKGAFKVLAGGTSDPKKLLSAEFEVR